MTPAGASPYEQPEVEPQEVQAKQDPAGTISTPQVPQNGREPVCAEATGPSTIVPSGLAPPFE